MVSADWMEKYACLSPHFPAGLSLHSRFSLLLRSARRSDDGRHASGTEKKHRTLPFVRNSRETRASTSMFPRQPNNNNNNNRKAGKGVGCYDRAIDRRRCCWLSRSLSFSRLSTLVFHHPPESPAEARGRNARQQCTDDGVIQFFGNLGVSSYVRGIKSVDSVRPTISVTSLVRRAAHTRQWRLVGVLAKDLKGNEQGFRRQFSSTGSGEIDGVLCGEKKNVKGKDACVTCV